MLRYPWQAPTPEEAIIPFHGRAPSKVMTDWVKGMFRRTFGKDTLAKTLLQNGCSNQVLVEYKRQDDQEHATQALLATVTGPSLAQRRFNLKPHALELTKEAKTARGNRWHQIQRDLLLTSLGGNTNLFSQALPRGIAARVALRQLPEAEQPTWMQETRCVTPDCNHAERLVQCYLCAAFCCVRHAQLVGRPRTGEQEQRLGAGSIRCHDADSCNDRVEEMKLLLNPQ